MLNACASAHSRRAALLGGVSLLVAGCGRKPDKSKDAAQTPPFKTAQATLEKAVGGDWRSPADKARDRWRHPAQSLAFWGVRPGATVVEFWPGAGWYTDILAPFLKDTGGTLYAADLQSGDPAANAAVGEYRRKIEGKPGLYGKVQITAFGPTSGPVAPAGTADVVLFLRNVHNWMAAGTADKAFHDAFLALKPGGVLGVEEHRADPGGVQDVLAANGYVQEQYVRRLAQDAGFTFDKASELNANPKDDHDHPFGVWTLAPTRLTAPRGDPPNPQFDRTPYEAIGESDRMTLRFIKPTS